MKISCNIIRDLLPLYLDQVCSEESKDMIENHLTECENCREYYDQMSADVPDINIDPEESADPLDDKAMIRKLNRRITSRQFMITGITLIVVFISGYPGIGIGAIQHSLLQMVGINICVYIAVLPIIVFTSQRAGSFMAGVAFAFFYGFVGMFASGHGLTSLYPISAGLGLINYQGDGTMGGYNPVISLSVVLLMVIISMLMLVFSCNKVKAQKNMTYYKKAENGRK